MSSDNWRGATWEVGLEHYRAYIRETGGPILGVDFVCADGFRLGRWVNTQRVHRRSGRLHPERFEVLEDLGLQWDPKAELQRSMVKALTEFNGREGHTEVPYAHQTQSGLGLGKWLAAQRAKQRKGTLPEELAAELESLGLRWDSRTDVSFENGLAEFETFVSSTGSTHVPAKHMTESGFALGSWFQGQKAAMTKGMPAERLKRLEKAGIRLERDVRDEAWQSGFAALASWVRVNGHANVAHDFVTEDGFRLGQWLSVQRNWLKSGRSKESRKQQLDSLQPDWNIPRPKWTVGEGLDALRSAGTMAFPLSASDRTKQRRLDPIRRGSCGTSSMPKATPHPPTTTWAGLARTMPPPSAPSSDDSEPGPRFGNASEATHSELSISSTVLPDRGRPVKRTVPKWGTSWAWL